MPRTIIAIAGPARSGKDTLAQFLVNNHNFVQVAFADKLKKAALNLNPLIPVTSIDTYDEFNTILNEKIIGSGENAKIPAIKTTVIRLSKLVDAIGWEKAKDQFPEVRVLLQRLGTEAGWQIHGKLLWPLAAQKTIDSLEDNIPVVISDLRFPAERQWVKDQNGLVIKIERPELNHEMGTASTHLSEMGISDPDITIINDGSLDDLTQKIDDLVASLKVNSNK